MRGKRWVAGGGFGPFASDAPTDPQVAVNRIGILNTLLSQPSVANDPTLSKVLTLTSTSLQSGQPIQPEDMQGLFGGGRGGRRGGAGGGGGGNP